MIPQQRTAPAPFRSGSRVDARDTAAAGALYPVFLPPPELPDVDEPGPVSLDELAAAVLPG